MNETKTKIDVLCKSAEKLDISEMGKFWTVCGRLLDNYVIAKRICGDNWDERMGFALFITLKHLSAYFPKEEQIE